MRAHDFDNANGIREKGFDPLLPLLGQDACVHEYQGPACDVGEDVQRACRFSKAGGQGQETSSMRSTMLEVLNPEIGVDLILFLRDVTQA